MSKADAIRCQLALEWAKETFRQTHHFDASKRPTPQEIEDSAGYFRDLYEDCLSVYKGYPDDDFTLFLP